jgi:hypothetical protein
LKRLMSGVDRQVNLKRIMRIMERQVEDLKIIISGVKRQVWI